MSFSFQHHHGAMLLKYSGISFISGAVNHGFFSGERSLWTAAIGMVLFVIGAAMEHRLSDSEAEAPNSLMRTLALGALLSIGLGFFTGGLQHFPDSPARSAWVVPLGFFISVLALTMSSAHPWQRSTTVYVALVGALVSAGSYGAWQWLERHPEWAATGHSHGPTDSGHGDAHDHAGPPSGTNAMVVSRSIDVRMDDRMRFTPDRLEVQAGETIRFVVHNAGRSLHEMVLGTEEEIRAHAQAMQQGTAQQNHSHEPGVAIEVEPGKTGELVVRFDRAGSWQIACLIPGHYEAGMRGTLQVKAAGDAPKAASETKPQQPAAHDHSTHKH